MKKKIIIQKNKEFKDEDIFWNLVKINNNYHNSKYFQKETKNCAGDINTCTKRLLQDSKMLNQLLQSNVINKNTKLIAKNYLYYLDNYDMMKNKDSVA